MKRKDQRSLVQSKNCSDNCKANSYQIALMQSSLLFLPEKALALAPARRRDGAEGEEELRRHTFQTASFSIYPLPGTRIVRGRENPARVQRSLAKTP
jgi:hypothetical protein